MAATALSRDAVPGRRGGASQNQVGEGYRPGRVKVGAAAAGRGRRDLLPEKEGGTNPLLGARGAAP